MPACPCDHLRGSSTGPGWFCQVRVEVDYRYVNRRTLLMHLPCFHGLQNSICCTEHSLAIAFWYVLKRSLVLRSAPRPKSTTGKTKQTDTARPVTTDATANYSQGITVNKDFGYKPQEQTSIER